jgi:hypothetical protein
MPLLVSVMLTVIVAFGVVGVAGYLLDRTADPTDSDE